MPVGGGIGATQNTEDRIWLHEFLLYTPTKLHTNNPLVAANLELRLIDVRVLEGHFTRGNKVKLG